MMGLWSRMCAPPPRLRVGLFCLDLWSSPSSSSSSSSSVSLSSSLPSRQLQRLLAPSPHSTFVPTKAAATHSYSSRLLTMAANLSPIEQAKRQAARQAVDEYVKDGMIVGVGSGSTVVYAAERLSERVKSEGLKLVCIPSSFQANQLIVEGGLTLGDLARYPEIDVTIDGADEVDSKLNCIKGGGGCHVQEKILISCTKQWVVVADYRKDSEVLGTNWTKGVPVEVIPMAYVPVQKKLEALGAKAPLRMAKAKAGPCVTDNGNFILDADFGAIEDPVALEKQLLYIPGIVEVGLFNGLACKAFFGQENGSVTSRT